MDADGWRRSRARRNLLEQVKKRRNSLLRRLHVKAEPLSEQEHKDLRALDYIASALQPLAFEKTIEDMATFLHHRRKQLRLF
jgi:hypothetical protein